MEEADREFLQAFETQRIPRAAWTHEAHLRAAWILLGLEAYPRALDRIREGILRLNAANGVLGGYHETVTRAYLALVHSARLGGAPGPFAEFKRAHMGLFGLKLAALDRYYSRERLMSDEARAAFVEPDRRPLPLIGTIRPVTPADAERIVEIYAPHIERSAVSFELTLPSAQEMRARIAEYSRHGWLVYEVDGRVVGYAYGSPHRARAAYQWCCEVSVYLDEAAHGKGVATLLYGSLFGSLRARGLVNAYSGITLPNAASVGFHESLGFKLVGVYERIGFKFGRWHDVGWWQLRLQEPVGEPSALRLG